MGVNEKGVISKGTGGFPVSSFATLVKTQKERYLEHDDFVSNTTLLQYEKTLAYNITDSDSVTRENDLSLAHSLLSVIISTHKAQFATFYSLP